MARSRNRKKAPKVAPRITVIENGKPVEVRADGSEPRSRRVKVGGVTRDVGSKTAGTKRTVVTESNETRRKVTKVRGETKKKLKIAYKQIVMQLLLEQKPHLQQDRLLKLFLLDKKRLTLLQVKQR